MIYLIIGLGVAFIIPVILLSIQFNNTSKKVDKLVELIESDNSIDSSIYRNQTTMAKVHELKVWYNDFNTGRTKYITVAYYYLLENLLSDVKRLKQEADFLIDCSPVEVYINAYHEFYIDGKPVIQSGEELSMVDIENMVAYLDPRSQKS
jgi:hypothetical protein